MNIDYYDILGLDKTATKEDIKNAYRTLSKKYHPDVNTAGNATTFFRMVDEAYQTLYNDDSRQAYDSSLQSSVPQYTYEDDSPCPSTEDGNDAKADIYPFRRKRVLVVVLLVLAKIVLFPFFVLLAFLGKVFLLLGSLVAVIGWFGFGVGVIACVIFLFQKAEWTVVGAIVLVTFLSFLVANIPVVIIVGIETAKDSLRDFIFS